MDLLVRRQTAVKEIDRGPASKLNSTDECLPHDRGGLHNRRIGYRNRA